MSLRTTSLFHLLVYSIYLSIPSSPPPTRSLIHTLIPTPTPSPTPTTTSTTRYAGSADNIGYIIPYPVIFNFLKQYEIDPKVSRVCDLGIGYMLCENPSLRERHKIIAPASGVLVTKVAPLSASAAAGIKKDDVSLHTHTHTHTHTQCL